LGKSNVAILGFGTVGRSVAHILCDSDFHGLTLTHIFNRNVSRKYADWVPKSVQWTEDLAEVLASDVDVIVELAGGLDPAGDWVRQALTAGKSVVTANKKLIAYRGVELQTLAQQHGCQLLYGAAVAGGVPVIPGLQQGLAGDQILKLEGILNGTCNFILSKMEKGAEFAPVVAEAQAAGYAERDPTEDVDGFDARAKLVILTRIGILADVAPNEISCRSIRNLTATDFAYANDLRCTIRQIARAEVREGQLLASVGPMLVSQSSPLAWSKGTENMVIATGRYGGQTIFSGHGAGGHPTAVAVVSDILTIAHGGSTVSLPARKLVTGGEFRLPHYIRFVVSDRPGIVAEIAGDLAQEDINIRAILQKPDHPADDTAFVVTVEPCRNSQLARALARIQKMDCLLSAPFEMGILSDSPEPHAH
jgi:homoserine dehydrogenase